MDMALPPEAVKARREQKMADWIIGKYNYLGKPDFDITSDAFWDMMTELVRVWGEWYRQEFEDTIYNRKIDLKNEKSLSDLVKLGFKKTVIYPKHFYTLMKWLWPNSTLANQEFCRKFALKFPIFKNSNYT